MKTKLDCIEINPSDKAIGSIIWLHGLGANGHDFVPLVPELRLPKELSLRFVFPHAPQRAVSINNGYVMPAWYDIYSISSMDRIDEKGIFESIQLVNQFIQNEIQHGIPPEKIVLAGFSQGAAIALTSALLYDQSLAGVIALSGYLPHDEKIFAKANAANFTTPIFLAHGTEDTVVPYLLGQRLYHVLQKNKYLVSWNSYPMGHSVCNEEIGDIAGWLEKIYLEK